MTLNGVMTLILRHFSDFVRFRGHCEKNVDVVVKSRRLLPHLLTSFLSYLTTRAQAAWRISWRLTVVWTLCVVV